MASRKRKPGLSLERHAEIGPELLAIHGRLLKLAVEVANAYPVSSKPGRAADAFMTAGRGMILVNRLRWALEDAMHAEHAEPGRGLPACYASPSPPVCPPAGTWQPPGKPASAP